MTTYDKRGAREAAHRHAKTWLAAALIPLGGGWEPIGRAICTLADGIGPEDAVEATWFAISTLCAATEASTLVPHGAQTQADDPLGTARRRLYAMREIAVAAAAGDAAEVERLAEPHRLEWEREGAPRHLPPPTFAPGMAREPLIWRGRVTL